MSEHWRELAERIEAFEDHPELVDIQLDRCLLAMARYLIETDRRERNHGDEQVELPAELSSKVQKERSW